MSFVHRRRREKDPVGIRHLCGVEVFQPQVQNAKNGGGGGGSEEEKKKKKKKEQKSKEVTKEKCKKMNGQTNRLIN